MGGSRQRQISYQGEKNVELGPTTLPPQIGSPTCCNFYRTLSREYPTHTNPHGYWPIVNMQVGALKCLNSDDGMPTSIKGNRWDTRITRITPHLIMPTSWTKPRYLGALEFPFWFQNLNHNRSTSHQGGGVAEGANLNNHLPQHETHLPPLPPISKQCLNS